MVGYIYLIIDLTNWKKYVGQHHYHLEKLDSNYHGSGHIIKRIYKKRPHTLKEVYLKTCYTQEELDEWEQYYIKFYNTLYPNGYNLTEGGNGGVPCEETRRKLSELKKGLLSGEKNPMFGKHHSEEFIAKMKTINRGSSDKLSIEDVSEIKKSYLSGEKQKNLALKYNVKISTINKIIRCKNWEWVESELNDKLIVYENNLKKQRNELILNMFSDGKTLADISKVTGCDYYTIKKIIGEDKIESLKKERKNNKNEKRKNIIKDYKNGLTKEDIMKKYNISSTTYVRCISDTYNENKNRAISEVKKLKKQGLTNVEIADILKIHRTTVTEYLKK